MASTSKVELRASAGKGQGLFATRDIKVGENILCEAPVTDIDDRTLQYFAGYDACLGPAARKAMVIHRSGLPIGDGKHGLFTMASKINHSCCPNANNHWSTKGKLNIQAVIDIKHGEEITITYIVTEHWDVRRQLLYNSFDFVCACASCTVQDKRRDVAVRLKRHLNDKIVHTLMYDHAVSEHTLSKSMELICSHLELRAELPGALYDAFQYACANRDRGAAEHYMALTLKYAALFQGEHNDNISRFERFNNNPAKHMIWGKAYYSPAPVKRLDVEAMLGF